MKQLTVLFALLLLTISLTRSEEATWTMDKSHSRIVFTVPHMVISEVTGTFKTFDGTFNVKNNDFSDTQIDFTIDVNTINTEVEGRDKHLKSDDFFNAEKFPQITLKHGMLKKAGDKYKLVGDLTIRDVTKQVEWDVTYGGTAVAWGSTHAGFKISGKVNRFDYGLKWNKTIEAGGLVAGDIITITTNVELVKKKEEPKTK